MGYKSSALPFKSDLALLKDNFYLFDCSKLDNFLA